MNYFLGARPYDFKDEGTGRQISGVSVHFCDDEQTGATGLIPYKVSMSNDDFNAVFGGLDKAAALVFKPVQVAFNNRGKPQHVSVISQK